MAELRFFFGTMGSGKSTQALQIRHNLAQRGLKVILTTQLDRQEGKVSSRLGVEAEADIVDASVNLFELAREAFEITGLDAKVCDEAQFYEPKQIEQLAQIVDELHVDVYAFGLLTSFQGELFPGTARLLELADVRSQVQVEARCWCGARRGRSGRSVGKAGCGRSSPPSHRLRAAATMSRRSGIGRRWGGGAAPTPRTRSRWSQ